MKPQFSTDLHRIVQTHTQAQLTAALDAVREVMPEDSPERETVERLIIGAQWFKDIHELQQLDMFALFGQEAS